MTNYSRISGGDTTSQRTCAKRTLRLVIVASLAIVTVRAGAAQTYQTLYSFKGSPDGASPKGGLVIGANGVLYGTTYAGGASASGTVYQLTYAKGTGWKETVLHNFSGSPDGANPQSNLVFGSTGALYGVTVGGGGGAGAIYELAPPTVAGGTWTETPLYGFSYTTYSQNVVPNGPLFISPSGTIYTTTKGSGNVGDTIVGLAVALAPPATAGGTWTEYPIYSFGDGGQGEQPMAGFVFEGGSLFGTTSAAGDQNCGDLGCGTAYELTPPATHGGEWTETTIYAFGAQPGDGGGSLAPLTVG